MMMLIMLHIHVFTDGPENISSVFVLSIDNIDVGSKTEVQPLVTHNAG